MDILEWVAVTLAAFRLTRLITWDDFPPIKAVRDFIIRKSGEGSALAELVSCPFCTSVWVAFGTCAAWYWGPRELRAVLIALAVSGAVSLVFMFAEKPE